MKNFLIILILLAACSKEEPAIAAEEEPVTPQPPCHNPAVKMWQTPEKIFFKNCRGETMELLKSDLKGDKGNKGEDGVGQIGPRGPAGQSSGDGFTDYCKHMPNHRLRTMRIKRSALIDGHLGYYAAFDHSGKCHPEEEDTCNCDRCNEEISFHGGIN